MEDINKTITWYKLHSHGRFSQAWSHIALLPVCMKYTASGESGVTNVISMCTTTFKKQFPTVECDSVYCKSGSNIFGKSGVSQTKNIQYQSCQTFYWSIFYWSKDSLQFNNAKVSQFIACMALCTVYSLTLRIFFLQLQKFNGKLINFNILHSFTAFRYELHGSTVTCIKIISPSKGIVIMHAILIASSCHGLHNLYYSIITLYLLVSL